MLFGVLAAAALWAVVVAALMWLDGGVERSNWLLVETLSPAESERVREVCGCR